jgi:phosphoribosyl-ATP pyrophosphohydrolase
MIDSMQIIEPPPSVKAMTSTVGILLIRKNGGLGGVTQLDLTTQDLINLEALCCGYRMKLEGADRPKETSASEGTKTVEGLAQKAVKLATIALGATLPGHIANMIVKDIGSEPTTDESEVVGKTPKTVHEFFDTLGINFEGEVAALVKAHAPVQSVNGRVGHVALDTRADFMHWAKTNGALSIRTLVEAGGGNYDELLASLTPDVLKPTPKHITPEQMGQEVDKITGNNKRDPQRIARRLLEECVELCIASGASVPQILSSIQDSIYNQSLKSSKNSGFTVFPSQLHYPTDMWELTKEIADVFLVMADLMYVAGIDTKSVITEENKKFAILTDPNSEFASDGHTFYLKKGHIGYNVTSTK